jgi:predicted RNA binding protein YcfA (HicA-like mRNA interferase family)
VQFPSLKPKRLLAILKKKPLSYKVVRQVGSHRWLESEAGYPPMEWAFHDGGREVPPYVVKKILTRDVGLSEDEARKLI